jgi:hypothetical protein
MFWHKQVQLWQVVHVSAFGAQVRLTILHLALELPKMMTGIRIMHLP